jgi:hypothetical protein
MHVPGGQRSTTSQPVPTSLHRRSVSATQSWVPTVHTGVTTTAFVSFVQPGVTTMIVAAKVAATQLAQDARLSAASNGARAPSSDAGRRTPDAAAHAMVV